MKCCDSILFRDDCINSPHDNYINLSYSWKHKFQLEYKSLHYKEFGLKIENDILSFAHTNNNREREQVITLNGRVFNSYPLY